MRLLSIYDHSLKWVLGHQPVTRVVTIRVACLSVYPLHPGSQGLLSRSKTRDAFMGAVMASQDISFQSMSDKMRRYVGIVMKDPAVDSVVGFAGGNTAQNQGRFFMMLKPLDQRSRLPSTTFLATLPGCNSRQCD